LVREEDVLGVCLELILSNLLQNLKALFLSIKRVSVLANLSPNPGILLVQVHILLSQECMDSALLLLEVFVRNVFDDLSLFEKMLVDGA